MRISNIDIRNLLIALLLVLPSFAFVPLYVYLLLVPLLITKDTKLDFNFYIIMLIILLCVINMVLNLKVLMLDFKYASIIPYTVFMFISYLFGKHVDEKVFHYLLVFISLEIFVGVAEYIAEVKTFFPSLAKNISGEAPFGYKGLFYYKRVAGLSGNSSTFAYKIFVGFLLLHYLKLKGRKYLIFTAIFATGLVITFTRSVILATSIFFVLVNIHHVKDFLNDLLSKKFKLLYILLALGILVFIAATISKWSELYFQLNRGMEDADLSQRDVVLSKYYEFLKTNPIFGNGSYKLWMNINGELFHGHNSFLQTFATHGFLIGLLFVYLAFRNMNRHNFYYLIPILVLSMFQYLIFWGVSFMDLIFFFFLLRSKDNVERKENNSTSLSNMPVESQSKIQLSEEPSAN